MKYMYKLLVGFLAFNAAASQCDTTSVAQEKAWEGFKTAIAQSGTDIAKNGSEVWKASGEAVVKWVEENICLTIGPVQFYRFVQNNPMVSLGTATATFVGLIYLNRWFHRNYVPKNGPIGYVHTGTF